jgi:adenosylmethionine-8-amino-7-oxononanoate aminotransferase
VLGSGTVPLSARYVDELLALRDRYGFLLVADEVATGFGRTGEFLASQRWSAPPDLLLLSKGLTNGTCAASAVVVSHAVATAFADADSMLAHAETQGGTALTCAAILATLSEMERLGAVANARRISARLDAALADPTALHPLIVAATGLGCFRSLRITAPNGADLLPADVGRLVTAIRGAGAIVHPGPGGIQLVPALTYTGEDLVELLDCVRRGLDAFAATAGVVG